MNGHFSKEDIHMANKHTHHQANTNQNPTEITSSHWSEWLKLTTQETTDIGEDAEEGEPSCTVGGNANWCSHSGKQCGGSSKN